MRRPGLVAVGRWDLIAGRSWLCRCVFAGSIVGESGGYIERKAFPEQLSDISLADGMLQSCKCGSRNELSTCQSVESRRP